jgi:hypothetical protein
MTKEKGGRYACEEDESQGEAEGSQGAGCAVLTSLRSDHRTTQEDREKEEVAAAA